MKKVLLMVGLFTLSLPIYSQELDVSAEIRPRYESRNGYKSLLNEADDAAGFISKRSRINFDFSNDRLKLGFTLADVRVWGDTPTTKDNTGTTSVHEAWAEAILNSKISFKMGRQEIVYDDSRIFGNVGWAQSARSHDAFIFKYNENKNHSLDIGLALNSNKEANTDILYDNIAGYKSFQYAWYHGQFNDFGVSVLALNTGVEYSYANSDEQKLDYYQTIGTRLTYKDSKFSYNASAYLQTGTIDDTDINASYISANIAYKLTSNISLAVGIEVLSGKDQDDTSIEFNSFNPLFGTNHKFNGWMDYFYVGNHANSVGLKDFNATLSYSKDKFSAKVVPHLFYSAANVYNGTELMDDKLGTEIDFTLAYKMAKDIKIQAGYSTMNATETMESLKTGDKNEDNNWIWVMMTFKPKLLSYTTPTN